MRRCLFIPTFNVAAHLGAVLDSLALGPVNKFSKILIVDNASSDDSIKVALESLEGHPELRMRTEVWRNASNYSLGGSTIIAIERALELGMDYLINLHSDGQARAEDAGLIADACSSDDRLVLGSRLLDSSRNEDYGRLRLWGNLFFAHWQKAILGREVSDLGALMGLPLKRVQGLNLRFSNGDMGYQPLLLMRLIAQNPDMEITEIPIAWGKVEFSNVNPALYGINHFYRLLRFRAAAHGRTCTVAPVYKSDLIQLPNDLGLS